MSLGQSLRSCWSGLLHQNGNQFPGWGSRTDRIGSGTGFRGLEPPNSACQHNQSSQRFKISPARLVASRSPGQHHLLQIGLPVVLAWCLIGSFHLQGLLHDFGKDPRIQFINFQLIIYMFFFGGMPKYIGERGALASDFDETECQLKCGVLLERSLPRRAASEREKELRCERESTHKRVFRMRDVSARYSRTRSIRSAHVRTTEARVCSRNAKQKNDSDSDSDCDSFLNIYVCWRSGGNGSWGVRLMKTKVFAPLSYSKRDPGKRNLLPAASTASLANA